MPKNNSICLLIPYSTILPSGKKLNKGLKQEISSENYTLTFIPEFTTTRSKQKTGIRVALLAFPTSYNPFSVPFDAFNPSLQKPLSI